MRGRTWPPTPVFLEVFILKSLQASFLEVRIPEEIEVRGWWLVDSKKYNSGPLAALGMITCWTDSPVGETQPSGQGREEEGRDEGGLGVRAMGKDSRGMDYCQDTVLDAYHSN